MALKKKIIGIVACMVVALPIFSIPSAAAPDAQLGIKIMGGFPLPLLSYYVGGVIENIGDTTAYDISFTLTIRGGMLKLINKTCVGYQYELLPHRSVAAGIVGVFGFGFVTITLIASASNAETVTGIAKGFQLRSFTWVPFSWIRAISKEKNV